MNLPTIVLTVRWMIRDTFRQSVSTKLFWVTLGITILCAAFCASVRVTGDPPPTDHDWEVPSILPKEEAEKIGIDKVKADGVRISTGEISFGFGAITVPSARPREDTVRFVQVWLAGWIADTAGVLLALLWTAGFLPTFLEPQSATVLLAKPPPRWSILLGKYLGVVGFVTVQAILFVGATWLAIGAATGVWISAYWLAVPLLVGNFAVFYSVSAFLAVWTRSTVASAFGTLIFWLLCWTMNYTHLRLGAVPIEGISASSSFLLDIGYWIMPKPLDLSGIFFDAMQAEAISTKPMEMVEAQKAGHFHPEWAVVSCGAFAAGTLALASYEFSTLDY